MNRIDQHMDRHELEAVVAWIWAKEGLDHDETWCGMYQDEAVERLMAFLRK